MTERVVGLGAASQFIVFVSELSGGYNAVFVLVLFCEDIVHHVLMQSVVGRVAMTLKLLPQVFFHLADQTRAGQLVRLSEV